MNASFTDGLDSGLETLIVVDSLFPTILGKRIGFENRVENRVDFRILTSPIILIMGFCINPAADERVSHPEVG